jgi:penicillin-binding protein 1A
MKKIVVFWIRIFAICTTIGVIAATALVIHFSRDLPNYDSLSKYHPPLTTRIYSSDGKLIQQYARENRIFVPISSIPEFMISAFIAAEDKNYFEHSGIDIISIIRAAVTNFVNLSAGKRLEGGSTITQQVVKNFLLTNERSLSRKVKEAVLSYMISKRLSKNQILELYLNQAYLGKRAYGVAAAAQVYFNKSIDMLTLSEAAFIAGLPKAPSKFDPEKNYDRSIERRDYVIKRMLEDGYINEKDARDAIAMPLVIRKRSNSNFVSADFFAENVRKIVIDLYGEEEFYTGGLTIITTLDSFLHEEASKAFSAGIINYDKSRGFRRPIAKISTENWQENLKKIPTQQNQKNYELAVILKQTEKSCTIGMKNGRKIHLKNSLK